MEDGRNEALPVLTAPYERIPEIRMDVLVRFPDNYRKHGDLG